MSHCALCDREVSASLGIRFRKCNHWAHAKCIDAHYAGKDGKINYRHCPTCLGEATVKEAVEPFPRDGADYVMEPGDPLDDGTYSQVKGRLFGSHADEMERKQNTLGLIQDRTPLDVLWRRHDIGLQHMLRDGVLLSDLLAAGYTWSTCFSKCKDFQQGRRRACDTLMALGASANQLRDYKEALPIGALLKEAKLEKSDICTALGLCFPDPNTALQCDNDFEWDAALVDELGLKAPDLIEFGLCNMQQYQCLFANMSAGDCERLEKKLGFTEDMIERLMTYGRDVQEDEPFYDEEYEEMPNPAYAPTRQPPAQRRRPVRGTTALERTRLWREKRTQERLRKDGFLG